MKYKFLIVISGNYHKLEDNNIDLLKGRVRELLELNNINYSEDQILGMINRQSKMKEPQRVGKMSFGTALAGAKALLHYTSGKSVDTKEMYRRSAICAECPLASKVSDCLGCGAAGNIARAVNAIRALKKTEAQIPSEIKTKYCGFCGCSIPLMVVTKLEDFHKENQSKNETRPDICWLKKTSINYKDDTQSS